MPKSMLVLVTRLVIMLVFVFVFVSVLVSVSVSVFGTGASWRRGFERWILAAPGGCGMQHGKCRRWSQTERPGTARVAILLLKLSFCLTKLWATYHIILNRL